MATESEIFSQSSFLRCRELVTVVNTMAVPTQIPQTSSILIVPGIPAPSVTLTALSTVFTLSAI